MWKMSPLTCLTLRLYNWQLQCQICNFSSSHSLEPSELEVQPPLLASIWSKTKEKNNNTHFIYYNYYQTLITYNKWAYKVCNWTMWKFNYKICPHKAVFRIKISKNLFLDSFNRTLQSVLASHMMYYCRL